MNGINEISTIKLFLTKIHVFLTRLNSFLLSPFLPCVSFSSSFFNAVNKSYILFHPHPTRYLGLILLIGNCLPLDYSFLQNTLSDLEMSDTEKFKSNFSGDFFLRYAEFYGHGFLKTLLFHNFLELPWQRSGNSLRFF